MSYFTLVFLLGMIAALCLLGIFSRFYRDNWMQFIGLVSLCTWSIARVVYWMDEFQRGYHISLDPVHTLLLIGIVTFGLGTAWRVWATRHYPSALKGAQKKG